MDKKSSKCDVLRTPRPPPVPARRLRLLSVVLLILTELQAEPGDARTFKVGLLCPRRHVRLGWDIIAGAASSAVDRIHQEGILGSDDIRQVISV